MNFLYIFLFAIDYTGQEGFLADGHKAAGSQLNAVFSLPEQPGDDYAP